MLEGYIFLPIADCRIPLDDTDCEWNTVLHKAATNGLLEHLKVLLEYGTLGHINTENHRGEIPLEVAMRRFLDSGQETKDQVYLKSNFFKDALASNRAM